MLPGGEADFHLPKWRGGQLRPGAATGLSLFQLQVFRFDACRNTWLQLASMLVPRTRFYAGVLNERLVAVGGGALLGMPTDTAEEYRLAKNAWRPLTPFPVPVADHAGATHGGILYISGAKGSLSGQGAAGTGPPGARSTRVWGRPLSRLRAACVQGPVAEEGTPTLFSGTGGFAQGQTLSAMQSYLPRLRCWVRNRPMAFARCDHGMATVGDRIFCLGGRALANVGGICSLPCGLPGLPEAQLGALCHAPWFCPTLWFFAGPAVGPCERGGVLLPRH